MRAVQVVIAAMYEAFNERRVEAALAPMSDGVRWPKASEGGFVTGKEEVRAYWQRQWEEFDPRVEPVEVIERAPGKVDVRVRQIVRRRDGELLFDGEVWHFYTLQKGLIQAMALEASEGQQSPSAAFAHGAKRA